MKRICFLAVLIALTSSAYAGSISFSVGRHRLHIESSRHCRSASCTSVSISRSLDWRHKRDRYDDERDARAPARPAPPAPQTVSPPTPPAPPAITAPAKTIVAAPPVVYTAAASRTEVAAAPPPPPAPPPIEQASIPVPPTKPVEATQPAPQLERVSHQVEVEEEPSDSPIGDWQAEGKGTVRIAKCGNALCGFVLSSSSEKGEAILINMKPKTERQWTGGAYSQDSGETYYGTMSIKGINMLRVEACALGRFYCSGNNWTRITRRADNLVTARQLSAEARVARFPVLIEIRTGLDTQIT